MAKKSKKWDAYTVAANCTDVQDCRFGIEELKKIPESKRKTVWSKKYNALCKKIERLQKKKPS